jgi:hypothetical protein
MGGLGWAGLGSIHINTIFSYDIIITAKKNKQE